MTQIKVDDLPESEDITKDEKKNVVGGGKTNPDKSKPLLGDEIGQPLKDDIKGYTATDDLFV